MFGKTSSRPGVLVEGLVDAFMRTYSVEVTLVDRAGLISSGGDAGGLEPGSLVVDVVLSPRQSPRGNSERERPGYDRAETCHNRSQSSELHGWGDLFRETLINEKGDVADGLFGGSRMEGLPLAHREINEKDAFVF
jgi:hypothetical protein